MKAMASRFAAVRPSHALFFVTYLAQGVQRIGKDYLRQESSSALGGDPRALQLFYNLLPEFGSLPWTLKPLLMLGAERFLGARGRCCLAALCALLCAAVWCCVAQRWGVSGSAFLLCTALVSLSSAVVDGLIDGRVAEESFDADSAASCRYLCEVGQITGGLLLGAAAWLLSLGSWEALFMTSASWLAVVPCILASMPKKGKQLVVDPADDKPDADSPKKGESLSGLKSMANRSVALVSAFAFTACLSPSLDFFLFRQHVLLLSASQQSLVSVAGSCGWFLGTSVYRHKIAPGRPAHAALRACLLLWPCGALASVAVALLAKPGPSGFWLAIAQHALAEFCKAMTFMPSTVLMQLHAARGCEGTAFTLMQWSGTIGQVLSRNLEYAFMAYFSVQPGLGSTGFEGFVFVAAASALWRLVTALLLHISISPGLEREAKLQAVVKEEPVAAVQGRPQSDTQVSRKSDQEAVVDT
ncbi:unnamed protein product, partial [Polarella glacialis]